MSESWYPSTSDVAALLTARTIGASGQEVGDFTNDTRPTYNQVNKLIEQAASFVKAGVVGSCTTLDDVQEPLRSLTALRTAMSVEISYFPEQVGTETSPFEQLRLMYQDEFSRVVDLVDAACSNADGDDGGIRAGMARYRFPAPSDDLRF